MAGSITYEPGKGSGGSKEGGGGPATAVWNSVFGPTPPRNIEIEYEPG